MVSLILEALVRFVDRHKSFRSMTRPPQGTSELNDSFSKPWVCYGIYLVDQRPKCGLHHTLCGRPDTNGSSFRMKHVLEEVIRRLKNSELLPKKSGRAVISNRHEPSMIIGS